MTTTRVLVVVGTRPEAIKLAPVVAELRARPDRFSTRVCRTGQHREMLDQALETFGIRAEVDLDLMEDDQEPHALIASMLPALDRVLARERPDLVVLQGDTVTTFAAALAAHLHRIPVAHVEAGLRTADRYRPFPEEMNRRLVTVLADLHFAPTEGARDHLLREGVPGDRVVVTGNTVVDALLQVHRADHRFKERALEELDPSRPLVLVTLHRRESFGEPSRQVAQALCDLAGRREDLQIVVPLHRNPRVRRSVQEHLQGTPGILLLDPVGYRDFVHLMARAALILTDSGGIQEEAPTLGTPVLVLREITERPEALESGGATLVGTSPERIVEEALRALDRPRPPASRNPFGDGGASRRIVDALDRLAATP